MRPECRPRDLEIQGSLPWLRHGGPRGRGGATRSATFGVPAPLVRGGSDGGTGPLTRRSGRMGSKDPVVTSGCMAYHSIPVRVRFSPGYASLAARAYPGRDRRGQTISTFSKLVWPGRPTGTPATTTT